MCPRVNELKTIKSYKHQSKQTEKRCKKTKQSLCGEKQNKTKTTKPNQKTQNKKRPTTARGGKSQWAGCQWPQDKQGKEGKGFCLMYLIYLPAGHLRDSQWHKIQNSGSNERLLQNNVGYSNVIGKLFQVLNKVKDRKRGGCFISTWCQLSRRN